MDCPVVRSKPQCNFFPAHKNAGKIIFYKNTTREHGGQLTFTRVGALETVSGVALAGASQAGGWFPKRLESEWDEKYVWD
jgi:hypothetical protein